MIRPLAILPIVLSLTSALAAEDWMRFRGPNGSGISSAEGLPVTFGPDRGVIWAVDVPFGRSTPVVTAERIFLTAVDDGKLVTMAIDRASGAIVWRRELERAFEAELHKATDSASSSPVTDGANVYAFFHESGLVSYDAEGNERWRLPLGPFRNFYGIAASPVLAGNLLYLVVDQAEGSYVLAVDSATGEERWRRSRPLRLESYATPLLYPDASQPIELVVLGSSWIDAYDLSSGDVRWSMSGIGVSPVASPTLEGDLLLVSAPDHAPEPMPPFSDILGEHDDDGDGTLDREEVAGFWMADHFGAVDVDASGRITLSDYEYLTEEMASDTWGVYAIRLNRGADPEVLWNVRQSVPYIPSPLVYRGVAYLAKDSVLSALDAATGELLKRGRLAKGKAAVYASPIAADGKVYLALTDGTVAVVAARGDWEILASNELGAPIYATPVVIDDDLLVRTEGRLYRLSDREGAPSPASD